MVDDSSPSPRASKRRRTATYKSERSILSITEEQNETENVTIRPSPSTRGTTRRKQTGTSLAHHNLAAIEDCLFNGEVQGSSTLSSGKATHQRVGPTNPVRSMDALDEDRSNAIQPRSSGRERRRPHRYEISPEKPKKRPKKGIEEVEVSQSGAQQMELDTTPALKGILTPSKERRGRPRKSVGFDSREKSIEEQFGFRDIDDSIRLQQAKVSSPLRSSRSPRKQSGSLKPRTKASEPVLQKLASLSTPQTNLTEAQQVLLEDEDETAFDQLLEAQQVSDDSSTYTPKPAEGIYLEDDPLIFAIKAKVLSRLLSSTSEAVPGVPDHLQPAYKSILNLLTATITTGESNSMLILGSRGSGKSLLLNTALRELNKKYLHDFHIVRLNGFLQTDDKLALREIWRQLGREMNTDGNAEADKIGSYADTMASLLALLSHPEDNPDATSEIIPIDSDPATTMISKSVVFILDEFDLFTTHPRQTLLYNLFDIAQSRKAPIAVMGCSTRMDVVECLEKRVKSRFSHRWVHIPHAKSFDGFGQIVKKALQVDAIDDEHGGTLCNADIDARKLWNTHIETSFLPSKPVQALLQRTFYATKSIPDLLAALYPSIASLRVSSETTSSTTSSDNFQKLTLSSSAPHGVMILPSLPTLQLSLLVAAARLDTIHNLSALNFNLVYHHYTELIVRSRLQQTASGAVAVGAAVRQWTREMAQDAWEYLGSWNLIVPAQGVYSTGGRDVNGTDAFGGEGANVRMWKVDVTLDDLVWALKEKSDIGGAASGAAEVLSKWCIEI